MHSFQLMNFSHVKKKLLTYGHVKQKKEARPDEAFTNVLFVKLLIELRNKIVDIY